MGLEKFKAADWRLRLYTLSVPVFWGLALGPGGGGAEGIKVHEEGAVLNLLLLIPLWRGSRWAVTALALYAMVMVGIGSIGIPPWGPAFGALALFAGAQFLLLYSYDVGPNSGPRSEAELPFPVERPRV